MTLIENSAKRHESARCRVDACNDQCAHTLVILLDALGPHLRGPMIDTAIEMCSRALINRQIAKEAQKIARNEIDKSVNITARLSAKGMVVS